MSRSGKRPRQTPQARTGASGRHVLVALGIAAAAVAAGWVFWAPGSPQPTAPPAATTTSLPPTPAVFARLVGSWVRPDGGYVLAVSGVAPDGTAALAYYNPRPIRVGRAEARQADGGVVLVVELNDRDYPGSTYTLAYDPAADVLRGNYFQAVQRANYDVVFERQR